MIISIVSICSKVNGEHDPNSDIERVDKVADKHVELKNMLKKIEGETNKLRDLLESTKRDKV